MKQLMRIKRKLVGIIGISLAGLFFIGCQTAEDLPAGAPNSHPHDGVGFQKGDPVTLDYSGVSSGDFKPQTLTIKEDGTITLPYISTLETKPVLAVGKTPGQLEHEVQEIYNKYYRTLTVTVQPMQRYFYVYGEVVKSGPYPYLPGETDIIKAITAAGGFTDFANKKKVQLKRLGAEKPIIVNCVKALENQKYNPSVYPGDTITVIRRSPWSF